MMLARTQAKASKQFFFAKKNQKTFVHKALAYLQRARQTGKSFCFFFQKEALPSYLRERA
jgi:hypothetical protein